MFRQQLDNIHTKIRETFGFVADTQLTAKHNACLILKQMTLLQYWHRPTNLAFHDLTTYLRPPANLRSLLGLGLKFIPTPSYPTRPRELLSDDGPLSHLERTLRLKCFFNRFPPPDLQLKQTSLYRMA